jgi:beta-glucanase (GH16 family)
MAMYGIKFKKLIKIIMKYYATRKVLLFFFCVLCSCKKGGADNGTMKISPSNLMVNAVVSTDGSGNVSFTATADNAVSYAYEFGNGDTKTTVSGSINYQYTTVGTTTYTVTVTATGSTGLTTKKSLTLTVTVAVPNTTLVWSDEFNTNGPPDATKWGYDLGTGGNGWGNSELEYYTNRPENVIVQNGVLKITAIKENYNGSAYTSTRLLSKDKYAFTYGKVDISARLPAALGTWPALWMLGNNIATAGWPACGEMDIMEQRGSELNKIYGTLHYPGHSGSGGVGSTTVISNASTAFHKYTLEWSAAAIKLSVDDAAYFAFTNTGSLPFNQDFFFIFNLAMGGNFERNIDPTFTSDSLIVDYIRVYK